MNKMIKGWNPSYIEELLAQPITDCPDPVLIDEDLMELQTLEEALNDTKGDRPLLYRF